MIFTFQIFKMKWRERISILSRKRKHDQNVVVAAENSGNELPSSDSSSVGRKNVENALSQIRPIIGPDQRSYYILLRGNEDSFTCIQPSKDVITNLDEVVKNVASYGKTQGASLPHSKTLNSIATKPSKNASRNFVGRNKKVSGPSSSANRKIKVTRSVNVDRPVSSCEVNSFETESVVEGGVLNKTYQTVDFNHSEVMKTSTLGYPLLQNHSNSSDNVVLAGTRQDSSEVSRKCLTRNNLSNPGLLFRKKSVDNPLPFIPINGQQESPVQVKVHTKRKSPLNVRHEPAILVKQDSVTQAYKPSLHVNQEPELHPKLVSDDQSKQDCLVQICDDASVNCETHMPEDDEKAKSCVDIKLVCREGGDLTDDDVAEQVKLLIAAIGKPSQIILRRFVVFICMLRLISPGCE